MVHRQNKVIKSKILNIVSGTLSLVITKVASSLIFVLV